MMEGDNQRSVAPLRRDEVERAASAAIDAWEQYGETSPWAALPVACRRFLAAYSVCGTVSHAARAARVSQHRHYQWLGRALQDNGQRQALPGYPEAFDVAAAMAADALENEARRRALLGWEEPIYQRGVLVGKKRRFSDQLLLELMAAARPDRFGRRRSDLTVSGPDGGPVRSVLGVVAVDARDLSDADLLAIVAGRGPAVDGQPTYKMEDGSAGIPDGVLGLLRDAATLDDGDTG